MTKSKQIITEMRAQIEILFKEGYSLRQIAKKLMISKREVQTQLKTDTYINKKRAGSSKGTIAAEDKHLIIVSKRHRRKLLQN